MDPSTLFWYIRYIQSLSMFIPTFSFLAFLAPEKSVTKIFKNGKSKNLPRDVTPRVMGPWPLFLDYTLLTLETKSSISFIEVGPQTYKLLSKMHFHFAVAESLNHGTTESWKDMANPV